MALLEKEGAQFDDISNDMEPFLKENTPSFMSWLGKSLQNNDFMRQQEIREDQEDLEDIQEEREEIVEKIREPKKGKSKLAFEELNSSQEQKKNRMKRFGLPVTEESEPNKTRKLDNNLPTRNKAKPASKKQEITEITIDRPSEKPSPTILTKKDNLVFKVPVPEPVNNSHVVTNNKNQVTISFANNPAVTANKLPQKCIFYPNCTKSDCPYLHPETPCSAFPHCSYGANCRYVHPPCRFADRCTKPGCPYAHSPFAQVDCKNGFICPGKGVGGVCKYKHPLLACRFGVTCLAKGKGCLFSHAIICTFGANCKTPGCKFAHVVKEEKNIVAKQQQQQQVNEEVDADVDVSQLSESLARTPPRDDTETNNTT